MQTCLLAIFTLICAVLGLVQAKPYDNYNDKFAEYYCKAKGSTANGCQAPDQQIVVWRMKPSGDFLQTVSIWMNCAGSNKRIARCATKDKDGATVSADIEAGTSSADSKKFLLAGTPQDPEKPYCILTCVHASLPYIWCNYP